MAVVLSAEVTTTPAGESTDVAALPQFEKDVHPLLKTYCWKCHGGEGFAAELDLRSFPLIEKGGKSGPVIEPGSAERSLLYQKLAAKQMPPGDALKPTEAHIATIKAWIDGGAPARYRGGPLTEEEDPALTDDDRGWWAFRKPMRPSVPPVKDFARVRTPIDAFLLARLEEKGLSFSPEADRHTLLRRVTLDLTGLPPTPDEIDEFVNETSPDAWERQVDRLLESPRYGERWGRHWLDAAGYVDVIGTDNDAGIIELHEGVWKYRDWVVGAFNADMPYDRFLLEQLAGDELVDWRQAPQFTPEIRSLLTATGFLRQASDTTYAPELNTADIRHQVLYDTLQMVSTNVLGLTLHCAQCHSHKFDPLAQADYFRLMAIFAPAYNVQHWTQSKERWLADVSPAERREIDRHNAEVDRQVAELTRHSAETRQLVRHILLTNRLATLPESIRGDVAAAGATPAEQRNDVQKYLAEKFAVIVNVSPEEIAFALDEPTRNRLAQSERQIAALPGSKRGYGKIQAMWDVAGAPPTFLYRRGGYESPGAAVAPDVPGILKEAAEPFLPSGGPAAAPHSGLSAAPSGAAPSTSGYRSAFARWLGRPDHPLTSRVIVNRVWQQHFGRGIVSTPDNFGRSGALPSHPELLDWLSTDFVRSGWRLKTLHRLIVTSSAYRQAARTAAATGEGAESLRVRRAEELDVENVLLWRMPLRRLESEIIRDTVLSTSGRLDPRLGGPPVPVKPLPDGMVLVETQNLPAGMSPFVRSLYLVARRNYQPTELSVFDQPIVAVNCTRRTSAAVALQSLTMLNGQFATEQAEQFARRVIAAAGEDESRRIDLAFVLALSRPAGDDERELARDLLARQAQRASAASPGILPLAARDQALFHLCHMLLNASEFLYIP